MELFKAFRQWAERPADERFWTPEEMQSVCRLSWEQSVSAPILYEDMIVKYDARDELYLEGLKNEARLSNVAFSQLCQKFSAPKEYLQRLPASLVCQNLNHGLQSMREGSGGNLLCWQNPETKAYLARCISSDQYQRIWHHEIAGHIVALQDTGWRVPPARPAGIEGERTRKATEEDCLRGRNLGAMSIKPGDTIAPAGLYASDRDCFVFMVDDDHVVQNHADKNTPLARGFFLWNSEVPGKSFGVMTFLYDAVCGNHIVWGAQDVREIRLAHLGDARDRAFGELQLELREYSNASVSELEERIKRAQTYRIGQTKDEVLDSLFGFVKQRRLQAVGLRQLTEAYDVAESTPRYGDPDTPWGIVQGLTQLSQSNVYADKRTAIDTAAGQILEMAF